MAKNECGHPGLRTLKLAVSQDVINVINWFLVCWYKFRKVKSYFNDFWLVVVTNGRVVLDIGTLKSAVYQEWVD